MMILRNVQKDFQRRNHTASGVISSQLIKLFSKQCYLWHMKMIFTFQFSVKYYDEMLVGSVVNLFLFTKMAMCLMERF